MEPPYNDEDPKLRRHVQTVLGDYARSHLTVNHVEFTRNEVQQTWKENLCIVPLITPGDIAMPVDPLQSLIRMLGLNGKEAEIYDEKWPIEREAAAILTKFSMRHEGRGSKDWYIHDDVHYALRNHLGMETLLSRTSQKATPKITETRQNDSMSLPQMLAKTNLNIVRSEAIDNEVLEEDQILSLRLPLDPDTAKSIQSIISTVPLSHRRQHPPASISFLRCDSPPLQLPKRNMSPPLFMNTRKTQPVKPAGLKKLGDLQRLLPGSVEVEEQQFDIHEENLNIFGGWSVLPSIQATPSPPPSPTRSESPEVDELWDLTPPDKIKHTYNIEKQEEVQIPRVRRIGYQENPLQRPESFKDIATIVQLAPAAQPIPKVKVEPREISPSLLGQASSTVGGGIDELDDLDDIISMDGDGAIEQIYRSVKGQDPYSLILDEKIDEREGWLMEVPLLSGPNVHPPSGLFLPLNMSSLAPVSRKPQDKSNAVSNIQDEQQTRNTSDSIRLAKVSGIQSLNIDLSWRPFIAGTASAPTPESVTDVDGPLHAEEATEPVQLLFRNVEGTNGPTMKPWQPPRRFFSEEPEGKPTIPRGLEREGLLITRAERNRALKLLSKSSDEDVKTGEKLGTRNAVTHQQTEDLKMFSESATEQTMILPKAPRTGLHPRPGIFDSSDAGQVKIQDEYFETPPGDIILAQRQSFSIPWVEQPSAKFQRTDLQQHKPASVTLTPSVVERTPVDKGSLTPSSSLSNITIDVTPAARTLPDDCSTGITNVPRLPQLPDPPRPTLHDFLRLRARQVQDPLPEGLPEGGAMQQTLHSPQPLPPSPSSNEPHSIPQELVQYAQFHDLTNLDHPLPQYPHRYMASFETIQKRGLSHHLASPSIACIELIERVGLSDVHLILDPNTAIVYFPLAALPAKLEELVERVGRRSGSFRRILIVFEAYPSSWSRRVPGKLIDRDSEGGLNDAVPYPFPPPVIKAFKQLRRSLVIAEASGSKSAQCAVEFAFALDTKQAARFARILGDQLEAASLGSGSMLTENVARASWEDRSWLMDDEYENEGDLSEFEGMNQFTAAAILSRVNIDSLLQDMDEEARLLHLGPLVGHDRIRQFNDVVEQRLLAILSSLSPEPQHRPEDDGSGGSHSTLKDSDVEMQY